MPVPYENNWQRNSYPENRFKTPKDLPSARIERQQGPTFPVQVPNPGPSLEQLPDAPVEYSDLDTLVRDFGTLKLSNARLEREMQNLKYQNVSNVQQQNNNNGSQERQAQRSPNPAATYPNNIPTRLCIWDNLEHAPYNCEDKQVYEDRGEVHYNLDIKKLCFGSRENPGPPIQRMGNENMKQAFLRWKQNNGQQGTTRVNHQGAQPQHASVYASVNGTSLFFLDNEDDEDVLY